jgi:hypothetical protein
VGIIAEQGWELVEEINLAPEIEEIYAVDTIDNEANLGILSSKGFLRNPKSSGIFSLTHATCSLRGGVWFCSAPLLIGDCSGPASVSSPSPLHPEPPCT